MSGEIPAKDVRPKVGHETLAGPGSAGVVHTPQAQLDTPSASSSRRGESAAPLGEVLQQGGNARKIKLAALSDPDLEPLWKDIGST
jgi:hypothetical protein